MVRRFQFAQSVIRVFQFLRCARIGLLVGLLAGILFVCPLVARAQDTPPGAIGRVEGEDISCDTPRAGGGADSSSGPVLFVFNGSVVTVHSRPAKMTLFEGGEVEICGPAKFTVLMSGADVTLALDFGRVRASLPEKTALRVFTPTIIGTPIDIAGGARDVTVGLGLDDSLCVAATSGAIQLEDQFTGEKLIVPQSGEFFLNAGRLLPVAGTPGSCRCPGAEAAPAPTRAPTPDYAIAVAPPAAAAEAAKDAAPAPSETATEPETSPSIEVSVLAQADLAQANQAHPVVPAAKSADAAAPADPAPVYTAVLPPLTFIAGSPTPPPGPSAETILLIREARATPDYEFSGQVAAPEFAQAVQHALGEGPAAQQTQTPAPAGNQAAAKPAKKKGGFWASLKRAFGGSRS
jgi:hypothetical protein